ncbi:MAG: hypothetical protein NXI31_00095 [bacterium]|nr:hypothetical protein [bacterium]
MATTPATSTGPRLALGALATLIALGSGWAALELRSSNARLTAVEEQLAAREATMQEILGEITRIRIEQRMDGRGPAALLAALKTYAPMLVSARTPEPDFEAAMKQMKSILRAFESVGEDAWKPVMDRIAALEAAKNFDELKWLLEAALVIDRKPALEMVRQVVMGQKLPSPRLRWYASDILLREDRPLAQRCLRQVLLTESSRGVNPERAAAYGLPIPDISAVATTGFHNFVTKYVTAEDPETEDTLLMVMGRTDSDMMTVQTCVKELGKRRTARAAGTIRKLFERPPGHSHNPLFQVHCLEAIAAIEGEKARPFFEQALDKATTETVAKQLETLLSKPLTPRAAGMTGAGPTNAGTPAKTNGK